MTEQERFYGGVNTAVKTVAGAIVWTWAIRTFTARMWLCFLAANVTFWVAIATGNEDPRSTETGFAPHQIVLFLITLGLGIFILCDMDANNKRNVAAQQAAYNAQQAAYAAQQARRPVAPPQAAQQRTERSVTVVRAPEPATAPTSTVRTYKPSDVQRAIAERSQPRRVRRSEDHGSFTITDRRAFDPDLGE